MTTVTITPVSAWTTPLTTTAVAGQKSASASDVRAPIQVLADRCEWLKDTLPGTIVAHSASTYTPVALYQFAGNLTATVGSDLTVVDGTAAYHKMHGLTGFWFDGVTNLRSEAAITALASGALTVEFIMLTSEESVFHSEDGIGPYMRLVEYGPVGGSGDTNAAFRMTKAKVAGAGLRGTDGIDVTWEYGAGGDDETVNHTAMRHGSFLSQLCHVAWTRSSDSLTSKLYINGHLASTKTASNAFTAGTSATRRLFVGGAPGAGYGISGWLSSLKICASELSAANVLSEYNSCFGDFHGTL